MLEIRDLLLLALFSGILVAGGTRLFAVNALTRNIAIQYAAHGIRANAILPGLMDTPLVSHTLSAAYGAKDIGEILAQRHAASPTGRMGDAWDVAYAALYLASDESKYVNGHCLVVDGGLTVKGG